MIGIRIYNLPGVLPSFCRFASQPRKVCFPTRAAYPVHPENQRTFIYLLTFKLSSTTKNWLVAAELRTCISRPLHTPLQLLAFGRSVKRQPSSYSSIVWVYGKLEGSYCLCVRLLYLFNVEGWSYKSRTCRTCESILKCNRLFIPLHSPESGQLSISRVCRIS
jgi:hypothetical protein